jgi:hypothetical protein
MWCVAYLVAGLVFYETLLRLVDAPTPSMSSRRLLPRLLEPRLFEAARWNFWPSDLMLVERRLSLVFWFVAYLLCWGVFFLVLIGFGALGLLHDLQMKTNRQATANIGNAKTR